MKTMICLVALVACPLKADGCGPLRKLINRISPQCEPVMPWQSQIGPVQEVPMQMPAPVPVPVPAQKANQQCPGGVCPVTVPVEETKVASTNWDF